MCLAVPGKVIDIFKENGLSMGRVDYSGTIAKVCLEYVPEIQIGQYAIVHAGFAITILNEELAEYTLSTWEQYDKLKDKQSPDILS